MQLGFQIVLAVAVGNFGLASFILLRNIRDIVNISFAGYAYSIAVWSFGLFMFSISKEPDTALLWAKLYYSAPVFIGVSLFLFCMSYPDAEARKDLQKKFRKIALPLYTVSAIFVATFLSVEGFLIDGIKPGELNYEIILDPVGYLIYSVYFVGLYFGGLAFLLRKLLTGERQYKQQILLAFIGTVIAGIFGTYFNLILPLIGNYQLIYAGPFFSFAVVISLSYAIVKHKLFDIRLVVARSLAYVLLLGTIALGYGVILITLTSTFFETDEVSTNLQLIYIALAVVFSFTLQPLKRFFDRATNQLFYRDSYDIETVINELSKTAATELDLSKLMKFIISTIQNSVKVEFIYLSVLDNNGKVFDTAFSDGAEDKYADPSKIIKLRKTVVIKDEISQGSKDFRFLEQQGISAVLKLRSNKELVGYMAIGGKQSGNYLNVEDKRLLEIISNQLAVAIQNARNFEQIQRFNITLQDEIKAATNELRSKNKKLKELDQAKDDFISMASHQLRTPLTTVKGYLSMLLEGDAGKLQSEQARLADMALGSAERMVYLITDLLNVSRLNTGKFVIEAGPIDLPSIVEDEMKQLQRNAKIKNITLTYTKPKNFPTVALDEGKIRQVIMNFTDNALYYTPQEGSVHVSLEASSKQVTLKVKDNGIGVPKHEQAKLFGKFYRAGNARNVRPDGTGLGLFMAKKVIIAQGGAVLFESEEGKGSTFGFTFPAEKIVVKE